MRIGHDACRHLVPYSRPCETCENEVLPEGDDGYGREPEEDDQYAED